MHPITRRGVVEPWIPSNHPQSQQYGFCHCLSYCYFRKSGGVIIDALICINKYIYIYREREHQGDTKLGHESSIIIRNDTNFTSSDLYRSTLIDNMICFQRRWLVFVSFLSRERVERGNGCRKFPRFVIVRFPIQERERKKGTYRKFSSFAIPRVCCRSWIVIPTNTLFIHFVTPLRKI